jgi:hypothetical protein
MVAQACPGRVYTPPAQANYLSVYVPAEPSIITTDWSRTFVDGPWLPCRVECLSESSLRLVPHLQLTLRAVVRAGAHSRVSDVADTAPPRSAGR